MKKVDRNLSHASLCMFDGHTLVETLKAVKIFFVQNAEEKKKEDGEADDDEDDDNDDLDGETLVSDNILS